MSTAKIIPFRQNELLLVDNAGEPFVPMKPVVEGMGLTWASQTVKLNSNKARWGVSIIETPSAGGIQSYLCIPLRKLVGWLNTIQPNKVRPELREGIIAYQNECDDVLWSYWNEGFAVRRHDRNAMTVIDELIGMTEVNVIKGLIRDKAKVIPIDKRRSFQHTMHSRLHTRFNVPRTELIPAAGFEAACSFIAAYALDGEWLPKVQEGANVLTDMQLYDVYFLRSHFQYLYDIERKYSLCAHLRALGCKAGVEMLDHFRDGIMGAIKLEALASDFEGAQRRLGLNQYSAR